jgi:hypothetical protein
MLLENCEASVRPTVLLPHFGQAAKGQNRWPRWAIECPLARLLLEGNSFSLFGLRRIGKSSVLFGIEELIRQEGSIPVRLELQGANRIEALVGKLVEACEKEGQRSLVDSLRSVYTSTNLRIPAAVRAVYQLISGAGEGNHESVAGPGDVLAYLEVALGPLAERLNQHEQKIILILDELPFFCQNLHGQGGAEPRHIAAFLSELRRWRGEGLTMLLAGSIGFHRLERDLGIDPNLFADLTHERLPPLDGEDAEKMVTALACGCQFDFWSEGHTRAVASTPPAAYPGFFHAIFLDLQRTVRKQALTVEQTADIAAQTTEKHLQENFFLQFDERLDYYQDGEKETAMKLFRMLKESPTPIAANKVATAYPEDWALPRKTKLLTALIQDDFLQKLADKQFAFATPMVAAWWAERDALNG